MGEIPPLLRISKKIVALPLIHGSGQCALTVRRWLLDYRFDCLAVPLPESFREGVEQAVNSLPRPGIVIQPSLPRHGLTTTEDVDPGLTGEEEWAAESVWPWSYVPIDPCQGVIMGIRAAMGEHLPRAYIDLETDRFEPFTAAMPDPYALRHVSPERFAAALLPSLPMPGDSFSQRRLKAMARHLRELEKSFHSILVLCSVLDWPWLRQAYRAAEAAESPFASLAMQGDLQSEHRRDEGSTPASAILPPQFYRVRKRSLLFLFGELPFITGLYERARADLEEDEDLIIDGVKELLVAARDAYRTDFGKRARNISPFGLSQCLKYIRNLSLISRRMTPDLYSIVTAAKQIFGDQFALHVVETACRYPYLDETPEDQSPGVALGIDQCQLPDGEIVSLVSRLPGPMVTWRTLELNRRPTEAQCQRWSYQWNPYGQCSYPPEDVRIENLRSRVFARARAAIGADLAKTEKFTTSVKDGIDIRDTVRHWYEKQIYVKVIPPSHGGLDACLMLFDSPADPRDYPWRTTWFSEHEEESTLAFYATDFTKELVGPGICLATYGGALFLYPPITIPDIWSNRRLDFAETLEERLLAAACVYSRERQIAILSPLPPGNGWRRLARRFRKQLVHIPTSAFSEAELAQLRLVHVLNGTKVRSYAEHFIRKA